MDIFNEVNNKHSRSTILQTIKTHFNVQNYRDLGNVASKFKKILKQVMKTLLLCYQVILLMYKTAVLKVTIVMDEKA